MDDLEYKRRLCDLVGIQQMHRAYFPSRIIINRNDDAVDEIPIKCYNCNYEFTEPIHSGMYVNQFTYECPNCDHANMQSYMVIFDG